MSDYNVDHLVAAYKKASESKDEHIRQLAIYGVRHAADAAAFAQEAAAADAAYEAMETSEKPGQEALCETVAVTAAEARISEAGAAAAADLITRFLGEV